MSSRVLTPAQLAHEGQEAYQRAEYAAAERSFGAAQQGYQAAGDPLNAAEMANNRSVALLQGGDAAGALAVLEGVEDTFAAGNDLKRQAMTYGNRAAALEALKRLDEAGEHYQKSAELLQQAGEHELRAYALQALSKIYYRTGRQLEALAVMRAGIQGIPHPTLKQRLLKKLLDYPVQLIQGGK